MPLTIDVLHDFVVGAQLLFVLGKNTIHAVNSCVRHELLKLWHRNKVSHIRIEHHVVGHAYNLLVILIMFSLADSVRQTPRRSSLAIWPRYLLSLRLVDAIVPAHIDKGLLVEELLLLITDELLGKSLDAKAANRLDKHRADRQLASLLHLSQVLIVLGPVLRI